MLEFKLTRETTEPVDRNLALLLLALANKYGALNADGTARLEFPITRQTMAELLGVSLETVMLMLRRFREREPIETRRSGVRDPLPEEDRGDRPRPRALPLPSRADAVRSPSRTSWSRRRFPRRRRLTSCAASSSTRRLTAWRRAFRDTPRIEARVAAGIANCTCSLPSVLSPQRTSVHARARSGPARWRASVRRSSTRSASAERTRSRNGGRSKARAQASAVANRSVAAVRARANP